VTASSPSPTRRARLSDQRSSETVQAASTANGAKPPAMASDTLLRAATQPISYPNNAVSPAPTRSRVA
jgi:hypothetical protein